MCATMTCDSCEQTGLEALAQILCDVLCVLRQFLAGSARMCYHVSCCLCSSLLSLNLFLAFFVCCCDMVSKVLCFVTRSLFCAISYCCCGGFVC